MTVAWQGAGAETTGVAIAHRAGNDRRALAGAIEAGADWVETDIWWHYGQLVARHERALWRLPLHYDQWKLALALRPALRLPELCDLLADGPQLLIDFKGSARRLPVDVVDCLRANQTIERAAVCGQRWQALDTAVEREPRLRAYYSIGTEAQLAALRSRPRDLPSVAAVSCAHTLLTGSVIAELRERGLSIIAWTVNDAGRAAELLATGVDGITTDSPQVLALVKDFRRTLRLS